LKKKPTKNKKTVYVDEKIIDNDTSFFKNKLKARSINQSYYINKIAENSILFCQGLAGTGKTHIAIGMALEYLFSDKVKKIIITRPVVEAGEKIGYLPGTAEDKLHPYLLPIIDEIHHFISQATHAALKLNNKIEVVPLGLMRGRNFHNSFIVADECQNASYEQLKMLITRIGQNSKMILTGDIGQSDLHKSIQGGFLHMIQALSQVEGVSVVKLEGSDIVRNPIIVKVLSALESYEMPTK
jgi:phosphate starvation-inducible PhoH-like protein